MRTADYLVERREEFAAHASVARMLNDRLDAADDASIEVRHVRTVKSGLVIHLYNVVEAVMTRTLREVAAAACEHDAASWSSALRSEWTRSEFLGVANRNDDKVIRKFSELSDRVAARARVGLFELKGEPGSWTDDAIRKVAERLGCRIDLEAETRRAAYEKVYENDTTVMGFLARRRNAIAHGEMTFEEGTENLTLGEIEEMAQRILLYLEQVVASFDAYVRDRRFLAVPDPVA